MKTARSILLLLVVLTPLLTAQIRGGGGGGGFRGGSGGPAAGRGGAGGGFNGGGFVGGSVPNNNVFPTPASAGNYAGFGSVVFPGGAPSFGTVVNPVYSNNQSFAGRLGSVVSGNPPLIVSPTPGSGFIGGRSPFSNGRAIAYPVFVGGYGYGYGGNNGYQEPAQVTIINQQPPVIVNPYYQPDPPARPAMQVFGGGASSNVNTIQVPSPSYAEGNPIGRIDLADNSANPTDEPSVYLIALKDGTIYASYAFWSERDTLHYITPGHAHNQVSLDRLDVPLSRRLNRERKLDFNIK